MLKPPDRPMSPDELIDLVTNGPTEKLVAGLAPLTESERKKLSKTAVNLRKELIPKSYLRDDTWPTVFRVKLALLGVSPQSEVQRPRRCAIECRVWSVC